MSQGGVAAYIASNSSMRGCLDCPGSPRGSPPLLTCAFLPQSEVASHELPGGGWRMLPGLRVRTPLDERREIGGDRDDLLEVVEQQQDLPLADVFGQAVLREVRAPRRNLPERSCGR